MNTQEVGWTAIHPALTGKMLGTVVVSVLLACTQSPGSRIIEVQMRTMAEALK